MLRGDPAALERLCRDYGDRLYDYCRSLLDDDDALSATVGAIYGAVTHANRLYDARRLRAWLYSLARAECQARLASVTRTGSYARQGRGGRPELAVEVLACLEPREREILDLALRHGLSPDEMARVLDIPVHAVESAARLGRHNAEQWLAAVMGARSATPRCSVLADLVKSWVESPTRLLRAHISRHVRACKDCQDAPPKRSITTLLSRMPILASPAPSERLSAGLDASVTAAETRSEGWHPDGFPVQPDALEDPPPPQSPLTVEEGFAPDRAEGQKPPTDFWAPDPEAADPESRIRWGRVGLVTMVSVASAAVIWSLLFNSSSKQPIDMKAAGDTIVGLTADDSLPPLVDSPPPPPPPRTDSPAGARGPVDAAAPNDTQRAAIRPRDSVPLASPRPHRSQPSSRPVAKPKRSGPPAADNGPNTPPPPPNTSPPKPSPEHTSKSQSKPTSTSPPPPPSFSASTASVDLGTGRQGSVTVSSQTGSITWRVGGSGVSASPSSGTLDSGQSSTIDFSLQVSPGDVGDCGKPLSTYMSISWSGDNKGTKGSGAVGVTITYMKHCPNPL
ncbi:RNA polymerase sigma factor [Sphaerisporangium album]|uniref:RNA polymerase sigma factor n=1 Tax=Sphaerisporangium album TaxID=509200 RepID=UPI0015EFEB0A|nr:sigma-70 family RNA polymerase sigma factor [Sphaerisporangium album]